MNMKKENPLTVQSKQWILEALLKLMEEKNYEKITIKELTALRTYSLNRLRWLN